MGQRKEDSIWRETEMVLDSVLPLTSCVKYMTLMLRFSFLIYKAQIIIPSSLSYDDN